MSKKDFIALADALKTSKPVKVSSRYTLAEFEMMLSQWHSDCLTVADACKAASSTFKRDRWLSYIAGECGPNGGKR